MFLEDPLQMFFQGWSGIVRALIVGVLAYVALVVSLRISGKRTLAQMNAFDMVVTVAIGSTLATILLSEDVALAEGLVAFVVLIGAQFVITWLSVRVKMVAKLVKSEPTLLVYDGRTLDDALKTQRVAEAEVLQAVRAAGFAAVAEVHAVVLETDGSFSVIQNGSDDESSVLRHLNVPAEAGKGDN